MELLESEEDDGLLEEGEELDGELEECEELEGELDEGEELEGLLLDGDDGLLGEGEPEEMLPEVEELSEGIPLDAEETLPEGIELEEDGTPLEDDEELMGPVLAMLSWTRMDSHHLDLT